VAGSCEHGNETSGSIQPGEFLDYLSDNFSRSTLPHGVSYAAYGPHSAKRFENGLMNIC